MNVTICLFRHKEKEYILLGQTEDKVRWWKSLWEAEREWYEQYHSQKTFGMRMAMYIHMLIFDIRFIEIESNDLNNLIAGPDVFKLTKITGVMRGLEYNGKRVHAVGAAQETQPEPQP